MNEKNIGIKQTSGVFWPREFLQEDFPRARVMIFGHNSRVTTGYRAVHQGSILSHVRNLFLDLRAKRREDLDRPLVFIAHSLGGIIVKDTLRQVQYDEDEITRKYS
jgi:hypothetical protein